MFTIQCVSLFQCLLASQWQFKRNIYLAFEVLVFALGADFVLHNLYYVYIFLVIKNITNVYLYLSNLTLENNKRVGVLPRKDTFYPRHGARRPILLLEHILR